MRIVIIGFAFALGAGIGALARGLWLRRRLKMEDET